MVPKLARPELEAPVARIARVDEAIEGMRAYGRSPLWGEGLSATLAISRATTHLLRAQLVLLGSLAGGGPAQGPELERFATGVELLHLFMLVHDDVMDNAALRRGRPALRVALQAADLTLEWQQARDLSIVVGNVLNVLAMRHLLPGAGATRGQADAAGLVLEGCCRAGAGQFQDLLGFSGLGDDEAFRRELVDKTAYHAFAVPLAAGLLLAREDADVAPAIAWGSHLGVAFQATDDLADLVASPAVTGKDNLRDLLGGRPSLPLLLLRRCCTGADREFFESLAGQRTMDIGERATLDEIVSACGVVPACVAWVRAELGAAARVGETGGFGAAREGMTAIERGLLAYLDKLAASATEAAQPL